MNSFFLQPTQIRLPANRPSLPAEREKRVSQITMYQSQIYNQLKIYNTTISGISDGRLAEEDAGNQILDTGFKNGEGGRLIEIGGD